MILENGFLKPNGASDFEDSPVISSLAFLFSSKEEIDLPIMNFDLNESVLLKDIIANHFDFDKMKYRRCKDSKYDFSRDQTIPLVAALHRSNRSFLVHQDFVTGRDFFPPSVKGHIKRCQGKRANWFENLWFRAEILFHAKVKPLDEPNQLICMMLIAGDDYLRLWKKLNTRWQDSIKKYWSDYDGAWRNEHFLAADMINYIESI
jgi:hypothetical protein